MLFDTRIAIQAAVEVRSAAGDVDYTYETIAAMASVPARIVPLTEERRGERMTVLEDQFTVLLGGSFPALTTDMVVLAGDDGVHDILRVIPPARRARPVTQLVTHRVAI
jgi:hypothetical protein